MKWDERFLDLAKTVSSWSKDPSTKVGAVIIDDKRRVVGLGYNGFPRGIGDTAERLIDRETKYRMVVHAEVNALLNASGSVEGCTMYIWPCPPCSSCAKLIIQAGIKKIVSKLDSEALSRWGEDIGFAQEMFYETDVEQILM